MPGGARRVGTVAEPRAHSAGADPAPRDAARRAWGAWARSSKSVLVDHSIDDAVRDCFVGGHEVVALRVLLDLLDALARVLGDDLIQPAAQVDDLAGVDLDVRRLALEARGDLVDEDLRVGQRHPL